MTRPVAIIQPDPASSAELRTVLEAAGFRIDVFSDEGAALARMNESAFSLAILDLDLATGDPFSVCRAVSRIVPVMTMTSDGNEEVCVRALRAGADDCVCRPIAERELVARVRNVLRRVEGPVSPSRDLEDLSLSLSEMRVRAGGVTHELTRGETEVLALLVEHAPTPLTSVQMARILGAKRGTVESRIKSLRRKIGPARIVTRGRFGYELT